VASISVTDKAPEITTDAQRRRFRGMEQRIQLRYLLLVLPALVFLFIFYGYPVAAMLFRSFNDPIWGFENFDKLFSVTRHEEWFGFLSVPMNGYLRVFLITLRISAVVTLLTLLLGYPVAYVLSSIKPSAANLLMIFVLVPFWTSILVRSYAWMVLLGREGSINRLLINLGINDGPVQLLNTRLAVYVGMVHILLPFMILPLYSVMRGIDRNYMRAAENLGAKPWQVFRYIFLPLSLPGIAAGALVVFILSLGFYITPALIGGPRDVMISMLIAQQVNTLNWGFASALALVLLVMALLIYLLFNKILGVERLYGGART
jgi:putative spermidine/putrescine transport system permease protein